MTWKRYIHNEIVVDSIDEFKRMVRSHIKMGYDIESFGADGVLMMDHNDGFSCSVIPSSSDVSEAVLLRNWLKYTFVRRMKNEYNCRFMAICKSKD